MKKGGCDDEKSHPPYFICIFLFSLEYHLISLVGDIEMSLDRTLHLTAFHIVVFCRSLVGNVDDCLADACRSEVLEVIKGNHTRSFILLDVVERTGGKGTPVEFHLGQTVHIAAILTDAISWEWVVLVAGVIIAPGICVVVSTVHLVDDETICRYYHHSGYSLDIVGIIVE